MRAKKELINPADAYGLAKAQELIWWHRRGGKQPLPNEPSDMALLFIAAQYEVTDEVPPKQSKKEGEP
jgi:hypothetical protein